MHNNIECYCVMNSDEDYYITNKSVIKMEY